MDFYRFRDPWLRYPKGQVCEQCGRSIVVCVRGSFCSQVCADTWLRNELRMSDAERPPTMTVAEYFETMTPTGQDHIRTPSGTFATFDGRVIDQITHQGYNYFTVYVKGKRRGECVPGTTDVVIL